MVLNESTCILISLLSSTIYSCLTLQNDISRWKWQELLSFFNADEIPHRSWLAHTREEFESILLDQEFARADRCQLLEVRMDRMDAPRSLILQAKLSADLNEE